MEDNKTKNRIVFPSSARVGGTFARKDYVEKGFKEVSRTMQVVVVVLTVAVVTMLFMVAGLILDAMRFNSVIYREYSEKLNAVETLQESNDLLLKKNKEEQEIIVQQQLQILELLKVK